MVVNKECFENLPFKWSPKGINTLHYFKHQKYFCLISVLSFIDQRLNWTVPYTLWLPEQRKIQLKKSCIQVNCHSVTNVMSSLTLQLIYQYRLLMRKNEQLTAILYQPRPCERKKCSLKNCSTPGYDGPSVRLLSVFPYFRKHRHGTHKSRLFQWGCSDTAGGIEPAEREALNHKQGTLIYHTF